MIVGNHFEERPMARAIDLDADPILAEMVRRLVAAYDPLKIYLFGSKAVGDDSPDSDYDLLVVVRESTLPVYKRAIEAFRLLCGVGTSKDVLVLTNDEFERKRTVPTSLASTVLREGRLLHAA